ncbi:MAG TPA: transposase [Phycisphaerae bacterium]|nr:transposase [Phycisphaerae bacterium]
MVLGYHLVLGAYGFWLPNDPRGSCSDFVASKDLFKFGRARTVSTRRSVAEDRHDHRLRTVAKHSLKRSSSFSPACKPGPSGGAFSRRCEHIDFQIWACSIMPDHVHVVVGRSGLKIEEVSSLLKSGASRRLVSESFLNARRNDGRIPSVWAEGEWKTYLSTPRQVLRAIDHVQQNPVEAGLKPQRWSFVTLYCY